MNNIKDTDKYLKNSEDEQDMKLVQDVINIGHGIYNDYETEESLRNFNENDIEQNKKYWRELSKNAEGSMQFYNPYIKDNFKKMSALDIYRTFSEQLKSFSLMPSMTEEEFKQNAADTKLAMVKEFDAQNLEPRHYYDFVDRFEQDYAAACEVHLKLNSEYTYQTVITKNGEDLSYLLENAKTKEQIKQITQNKIAECIELGIPEQDIASVIFSGFENNISNNIDEIDTDDMISVLADLTVENNLLKDIVPNFEILIKDMMMRVARLNEELQIKNADKKYFIKQNNKHLALKEFLKWYKSNKNAFPDEIDNVLLELIKKYNIENNSYLFTLIDRKSLLKNYKQLNPFVISMLERKSINGTLQTDEIEQSLLNGLISINDGIRLVENLEHDMKPEVLKLEMSFDDKIFNGDLDSLMKRAVITINLHRGDITLSNAQEQLEELVESAKSVIKQDKN